tara:strand:- start:55 stop:732 length:678 start_codon:yes stop_codon:yes gene_type:complete
MQFSPFIIGLIIAIALVIPYVLVRLKWSSIQTTHKRELEEARLDGRAQEFADTIRRLAHNNFVWLSDHMDHPLKPHYLKAIEQARDIVSNNLQGRYTYELDIARLHFVENEVIHVGEAMCGRLIPLGELIDHLLGQRLAEVDRVVADFNGLQYFVGEACIMSVAGGSIYPGRLADPGNRYEVAGVHMSRISGLEIDGMEAFRKQVASIEIRYGAGGWYITAPVEV